MDDGREADNGREARGQVTAGSWSKGQCEYLIYVQHPLLQFVCPGPV